MDCQNEGGERKESNIVINGDYNSEHLNIRKAHALK